jgi:hypothetical protein
MPFALSIFASRCIDKTIIFCVACIDLAGFPPSPFGREEASVERST